MNSLLSHFYWNIKFIDLVTHVFIIMINVIWIESKLNWLIALQLMHWKSLEALSSLLRLSIYSQVSKTKVVSIEFIPIVNSSYNDHHRSEFCDSIRYNSTSNSFTPIFNKISIVFKMNEAFISILRVSRLGVVSFLYLYLSSPFISTEALFNLYLYLSHVHPWFVSHKASYIWITKK